MNDATVLTFSGTYVVFILWYFSGFNIYCYIKYGKDLDSNRYIRTWRWIYHELKPFVIPMIVVMCATYPFGVPANAIDAIINIIAWKLFKDIDKDDRWKKRLARAKDKVRAFGSKLVVVPEST